MKSVIRLKNPNKVQDPYYFKPGSERGALTTSKSRGFIFPKSQRFEEYNHLGKRTLSHVGPGSYIENKPRKIRGGLIYSPIRKSFCLSRLPSSEKYTDGISNLLAKKIKFKRSLTNKRTYTTNKFFCAGDKFFITKCSPII